VFQSLLSIALQRALFPSIGLTLGDLLSWVKESLLKYPPLTPPVG